LEDKAFINALVLLKSIYGGYKMKILKLGFVFLIVLFAGCSSVGSGSQSAERPDSDLYSEMEYLVRENDYLVLAYNIGTVIDDYTYESNRDTETNFSMWSWTFTKETMTCMITVRMGDEIVAQVFSSDEKSVANSMRNDFRNKNYKVVFLDEPSRRSLINAYNDMMSGI
jgi:hypothetical protein